MRRRYFRHVVNCLAAAFVLQTSIAAADDVVSVLTELSRKAAQAEHEMKLVIAGSGGNLFLVSELRAISIGPFWGDLAPRVSRASKPEYADPLPAIIDFHRQLREAGIELLIVPVPAKVAIDPEAITALRRPPAGELPPRIDIHHREFYRRLAELDIQVLDLTPEFMAHRTDREGEPFCRTDTHWSGRGIELAARAIAEKFADRDWIKEIPRLELETRSTTVEIAGDMARMIDEEHPAKEKIPIMQVGMKSAREITPLPPDRDSPVLLMGDSHTLVFHDPTLYARGAGLPDQLARHWGFAVDLIGVRGSGATTTRIELLRRQDNLKGKKLVIWCFSCREFTESTTGWRKVPVIR